MKHADLWNSLFLSGLLRSTLRTNLDTIKSGWWVTHCKT